MDDFAGLDSLAIRRLYREIREAASLRPSEVRKIRLSRPHDQGELIPLLQYSGSASGRLTQR